MTPDWFVYIVALSDQSFLASPYGRRYEPSGAEHLAQTHGALSQSLSACQVTNENGCRLEASIC